MEKVWLLVVVTAVTLLATVNGQSGSISWSISPSTLNPVVSAYHSGSTPEIIHDSLSPSSPPPPPFYESPPPPFYESPSSPPPPFYESSSSPPPPFYESPSSPPPVYESPPPPVYKSPPPPPPYRVLNPPSPQHTGPHSPPPPPTTPNSWNISPSPPSKSTIGIVVGVSVGSLIFFLLLGFLIFFLWRRSRKSRNQDQNTGFPDGDHNMRDDANIRQTPPHNFIKNTNPPLAGIIVDRNPPQHNFIANLSNPHAQVARFGSNTQSKTYEELVEATCSFSEGNVLGKGGFGFVYKGVLRDGMEVAVKRLTSDSLQGDREFQAEIETINRVHHKHLVSLVGYCFFGNERLLVYEFVPNASLAFQLHGKNRPLMEWEDRMRVARGSAVAIAYLHEFCEPKIIHRDIKAANILIDLDFNPKVADFGLAKFCVDNNTHVTTRVVGTIGYLAPEYAGTGQLTDKSDVYSFGVVLLELITGQSPLAKTHLTDGGLVDWARPLMMEVLKNGDYDKLVDPRLEKRYNPEEMESMVFCAAACVRHSAKLRPKISKVIGILEGNLSRKDLDGVLESSDDLSYHPSNSEHASEVLVRSENSGTLTTNERDVNSNNSLPCTTTSQTLRGR